MASAQVEQIAQEIAEVFDLILGRFTTLLQGDASNQEALKVAVQEAEDAKAKLNNYDASVASLFSPILEKAKVALTYANASTPPATMPEVPEVPSAIG